jgi:hypothetical protein
MSRAKRSRTKERRRRRVTAEPESGRPVEPVRSSSRLAPVRSRLRTAKIGVVAFATAAVGASMPLARITYAGHSKHSLKPLAVPQPMYAVVRRNLLQAGILAPATAPPDAATSTS